ncbi:hypothetical protein O181_007925 [Austropuccinia psidii MF-1]|uniref:Uncharacterized protein n=1 Tax=Austropuccinia psidii MF-1 TaxID=1389203 RepID=A0A9Q3BNZ0_9BASI|nr:hypothetical protein [Austropuccinia psidii MF-1]
MPKERVQDLHKNLNFLEKMNPEIFQKENNHPESSIRKGTSGFFKTVDIIVTTYASLYIQTYYNTNDVFLFSTRNPPIPLKISLNPQPSHPQNPDPTSSPSINKPSSLHQCLVPLTLTPNIPNIPQKPLFRDTTPSSVRPTLERSLPSSIKAQQYHSIYQQQVSLTIKEKFLAEVQHIRNTTTGILMVTQESQGTSKPLTSVNEKEKQKYTVMENFPTSDNNLEWFLFLNEILLLISNDFYVALFKSLTPEQTDNLYYLISRNH